MAVLRRLCCDGLFHDALTLCCPADAAPRRIIKGGFLHRGASEAGGERIQVREFVPSSIEFRSVAMSGHGDIGEVSVHGCRRQDKCAIDGRTLALVDRGGIAMVDRPIGGERDGDHLRPAVDVRHDLPVRDALHGGEHPILDLDAPEPVIL